MKKKEILFDKIKNFYLYFVNEVGLFLTDNVSSELLLTNDFKKILTPEFKEKLYTNFPQIKFFPNLEDFFFFNFIIVDALGTPLIINVSEQWDYTNE